MEDKFNLGIEISENVISSSKPSEIKRYDVVESEKVEIKENETKLYRYRPGVNSFMTGDLDV